MISLVRLINSTPVSHMKDQELCALLTGQTEIILLTLSKLLKQHIEETHGHPQHDVIQTIANIFNVDTSNLSPSKTVEELNRSIDLEINEIQSKKSWWSRMSERMYTMVENTKKWLSTVNTTTVAKIVAISTILASIAVAIHNNTRSVPVTPPPYRQPHHNVRPSILEEHPLPTYYPPSFHPPSPPSSKPQRKPKYKKRVRGRLVLNDDSVKSSYLSVKTFTVEERNKRMQLIRKLGLRATGCCCCIKYLSNDSHITLSNVD